MKKIILTIIFILFLAPTVNAKVVTGQQTALKEVRAVLNEYVKYENEQNIDGIKSLHADEYITVDAMPKKVYIDIVNKTWKKYSDIKHQLKLTAIMQLQK